MPLRKWKNTKKKERKKRKNSMSDLYKKRSDLIIDYISQILVYGSDTTGNIAVNKNEFEDGEYLILAVSVVKNSYFRWHDLGIKLEDSKEFYKVILKDILDKFKEFNIITGENNIIISSSVNNNKLDISFTFVDTKIQKWFEKECKAFYNEIK